MSCKELYDSFMEYSQKGQYDKAAGVAINWLNEEKGNPFQNDTAEHELFFKASRAFKRWQMGGIDSRVSRVRMENYVKELAQLKALNPYTPVESGFRVLGVVPEDVKIVDEPDAIAGWTVPAETTAEKVVETAPDLPVAQKIETRKVEDPTIVLGVVPEEKPKFFKRHKE